MGKLHSLRPPKTSVAHTKIVFHDSRINQQAHEVSVRITSFTTTANRKNGRKFVIDLKIEKQQRRNNGSNKIQSVTINVNRMDLTKQREKQ